MYGSFARGDWVRDLPNKTLECIQPPSPLMSRTCRHCSYSAIISTGSPFIVAILRRFRLSPVLGYLIAGAAIGDHGLKIVTYDQTKL
ncbi:MAG: hypothetical protein O7C62_07585, partial [Rickettsia endosymbiont of Ixodes persulcatus]|nr:hypothetical protein [Rickettsia endosymbiont of Ixodes persulcatus]